MEGNVPPKPKFTKEDIVNAAMKIVAEKGINALTAQELKGELNSSASPIFTLFNSMREIEDSVRVSAMAYFNRYVGEDCGGATEVPLFKKVGIRMISFAIEEPRLYQLLFMEENKTVSTFDDLLLSLGDYAPLCIDTLEKEYSLSSEEAKKLFKNVWIYTYGLGALCATRVCNFSLEELSNMLTTEFSAMMILIKNERKGEVYVKN